MIDRAPPRYLIDGEPEGRERLRRLARVMWPTTLAFLKTFPLAPDARAWTWAVVGGDATVVLSRRVPQGHVTGIDFCVELYSQSARARGCDPCIGPRLPGLVQSAGFSDVSVGIVQPSGTSGDVKLIAAIPFDAIADSVLTGGLETSDNLRATSEALYDFARQQGSFMSIPRIFQCSGARRP